MIIYKYKLEIAGEQTITMPDYSQLLDAQMQGNELMIWANINPVNSPIQTKFKIVGTGQEYESDPNLYYFKTVQDNHGFVWHIFLDKTVVVNVKGI